MTSGRGGKKSVVAKRGSGDHVARKRFGQHFLKDSSVLQTIAAALGDTTNKTVLEIGPGRGALTDVLLNRVRRLVAIELDRDLVSLLRTRYAGRDHVEIVEADVLDVSLTDAAGGPYSLVGNVPYYITTPILFHALERPRPDVAVFLVQREVAERMVAAPGSKTYGALSVNLQALAQVEILRHVPPGAFQPPPSVESSVVRVIPRLEPIIEENLEKKFQNFVLAAFGLRRKQLVRVVRTVAALDATKAGAIIEACGLLPEARPETLTPGQFAALVRALDNV